MSQYDGNNLKTNLINQLKSEFDDKLNEYAKLQPRGESSYNTIRHHDDDNITERAQFASLEYDRTLDRNYEDPSTNTSKSEIDSTPPMVLKQTISLLETQMDKLTMTNMKLMERVSDLEAQVDQLEMEVRDKESIIGDNYKQISQMSKQNKENITQVSFHNYSNFMLI